MSERRYFGLTSYNWFEAITIGLGVLTVRYLEGQLAPPAAPPVDEVGNAATLLGVDRNASVRQIKRAFRAKMLSHHPDRGGDAELTQRLIAAKKLLISKQIKVHA